MIAQCESPILPSPSKATRIIVLVLMGKYWGRAGYRSGRGLPGSYGIEKARREQAFEKGLHHIDQVPPGPPGARPGFDDQPEQPFHADGAYRRRCPGNRARMIVEGGPHADDPGHV